MTIKSDIRTFTLIQFVGFLLSGSLILGLYYLDSLLEYRYGLGHGGFLAAWICVPQLLMPAFVYDVFTVPLFFLSKPPDIKIAVGVIAIFVCIFLIVCSVAVPGQLGPPPSMWFLKAFERNVNSDLSLDCIAEWKSGLVKFRGNGELYRKLPAGEIPACFSKIHGPETPDSAFIYFDSFGNGQYVLVNWGGKSRRWGIRLELVSPSPTLVTDPRYYYIKWSSDIEKFVTKW